MKASRITEENIRHLVDCFYSKIRTDEKLGPIFAEAIGEDLETWKPHLQKMYDFWSSVMLSSGRYHGNPFEKHLALPDLDAALFDRWLKFFEESARELYSEEIAESYAEKSSRIAASLKMGMFSSGRKFR